jgi:hypothetical protein
MHHIDLTNFYQQVVDPFLITLGSGVVLYLTALVRSWVNAHLAFLGQQTDAQLADGFNRALQNGVAIAMKKVDELEASHTDVDVKSWLTAKAAQYAIDHSPDAMKRFTGLTPEGAALKALAYLPDVKTIEDVQKYNAQSLKPAVVTVSALPPVT